VSKTPPPMLGFNNNVRHHGRVFHIQTEDSGIKRPHIITHLFADGGRILKSLRTDYSEHVGSPEMPQTVKRLMKEQHKAMFVALRAGEFDPIIAAAFGPLPATVPPSSPDQPLPSAFDHETPSPEEVAARITPEEPASVEEPMPVPPLMLPAEIAANLREELSSMSLAEDGLPPPPSSSVERAAAAAVVPPPRMRVHTPPAPSHSIGSAVEAMAAKVAGVPVPNRSATPVAGTPLSSPSPLMRRAAAGGDLLPGRYSISRPASIFGEAPPPDTRSIFGDPLIGEKSLDEVILSYLAEDLENPSQK